MPGMPLPGISPSSAPKLDPARPEDNKAAVRRFYQEIDDGNLDAVDELVAENYLDHSPPTLPRDRLRPGGPQTGIPDVLGRHPRPA